MNKTTQPDSSWLSEQLTRFQHQACAIGYPMNTPQQDKLLRETLELFEQHEAQAVELAFKKRYADMSLDELEIVEDLVINLVSNKQAALRW